MGAVEERNKAVIRRVTPLHAYCSQNQRIGYGDVLDMASGFHSQAQLDIVGEISVRHECATFNTCAHVPLWMDHQLGIEGLFCVFAMERSTGGVSP